MISTRISWKADLNVSFYIELPVEDRISIIHYWVRRDTDRLFIGWFQKIFRRKIWSHMMCIYQWFIVEKNPYWKCYKNRTWFITFESKVQNFWKIDSINQDLIANRIGKEFVENFDFYGRISHQLVVKCVFGISRKFTSSKIFRFLGIKSEISQFGSFFAFQSGFLLFLLEKMYNVALTVSLQWLLPSIFVELNFYQHTLPVNNKVMVGVFPLI